MEFKLVFTKSSYFFDFQVSKLTKGVRVKGKWKKSLSVLKQPGENGRTFVGIYEHIGFTGCHLLEKLGTTTTNIASFLKIV